MLEFFDLKDEYFEYDFEDVFVYKLEEFFFEFGSDFVFIGW